MTGDDDELDSDSSDVREQPGVDAADARSYRKQRNTAEFRKRQAQEFWQRVFADPIGRREMWGILQEAHAFEERFACGPSGFPQPEATWFQAGIQSLGQRLFQSWTILDRAGVFMMLDEFDPRFVKPKPAKNREGDNG
jgi:hypothetical protein